MNIIKPQKLRKNSVIGLITPASSPKDLSSLKKGINYLEKNGYRVKVGKNVGKYNGYLAGKDSERLSDLHEMFTNKNISAIFCVRGGYGTGRLLDKIDYNLIKKNPKIFVGYSDITALQMAILKKTGLVTFSGPMVLSDFANNINKKTEELFWRMLTSSRKIGKLNSLTKLKSINGGASEGELIGGNLTTLISIIGSNFLPKFDNKILFLEDIDEPIYKIDRMLNQLKLCGALNKINGVILGAFTNCKDESSVYKPIKLEKIFENYFKDLDIPVVHNFSHGHIKKKLTLPFGLNCKLNADKLIVEFNESGVI